MHRGIHVFHREVGALDHAHLDACAAEPATCCRPLGQTLKGGEGIRQIGLQHDAGLELAQLRLVEQLLEDGDGQVEVFELFHVEVDELRGGGCRGKLVQRSQPLHHLRHHLVERPHRELARDGRDLDRHVVDVVAGEKLAGAGEATIRLVIAEDGLAEQVQVEPDPLAAQRLQGLGELRRRRIHDEVRHHAAKHPAGDRHDRPRDERRESPAGEDRGPQVPGQERGDAVAQLFEVASGHPQIVGTHHLVNESEGKREPLGVLQHTGEPLGADIGLHCGTLGEPPTHGGDRLIREVGLGGARVGVLE